MDPLSVTAGVVGLLAVIAQITTTVNTFAEAVNDRKQDIRDLHQELLLLGGVLGQLRDFLASEQAKDASFDEDSVIRHAIGDCTERLERLGDRLKPSKSGKFGRALERLRWPLEQDEVQKLMGSLQRFVQTFQFALTTAGLTILSKTADAAETALREQREFFSTTAKAFRDSGMPTTSVEVKLAEVDAVTALLPSLLEQTGDIKEMSLHLRLQEEREQARQKSEILEWLAPASRMRAHLESQRKRVDQTCQWFLDSDVFQTWSSLEAPAHDILCTGNPGVGKTILASICFDHLRTRYRQEDVVITNYYCSHFDEETQTASHFARVLLRQICQSLPRLPSSVVDFYRDTRHEVEDILWLQELQSVLRRVIATCDHLFLVIDALDEVEDLKQRNLLLRTMQDVRSANRHFKVLSTARPHVSQLPAQLLHPTIVDVAASPNDVRQFLKQKLAEQADPELIDAAFEQEMIDRLCSSSSGTFLLPALQLNNVLQQLTKADMRRALSELSQTLPEAFQTSLNRIQALSPARKELALRTMLWVSYAKRPLLVSELQHALATRDGGLDIDLDNIVPARLIIESCAGLVQHDQSTNSISFFHFSVDEYLRSRADVLPPDETIIARTCLSYLLHSSLKSLASMKEEDLHDYIEKQALFRYAAYHWGIHARQLQIVQYSDLALQLFDNNLNILAISRLRQFDNPFARNRKRQATTWVEAGQAGISIASFFGLADLLELLISRMTDKSSINSSRNMYGNPPLQVAAGCGHTEVCEVLNKHGADLLDTNGGKSTAFYQAVGYGRLETAKALLRHDLQQLEVHCRAGWTPLHKAADLGDEIMVEFLLQAGAHVNARDYQQRIPLHLAAKRGHKAVVRLLVLACADINASSREETPLDVCSTTGHAEVAQYLIEQGASIEPVGRDGWTPLFRACRGGHNDIAKLLLRAGANVQLLDFRRNSCLFMACRSGDLPLVKTLIEHEPTLRLPLLRMRDQKDRNAQQIALITAHIDVYKYLRDLEIQLAASDGLERQFQLYNPVISLAQAIETRDLTSVQALVARNPEVLHHADGYGQQPIHTAFIECAVDIATFLLESGASIHATGFHGWQPIHIAASVGNLTMTELALGHGADIEAKTGTGQTPLLKAASSGSLETVRRLLEAGADISARNDRGMTSLHIVANKRWMEGLREFLRPDWGGQHLVHSRDRNKNMPRNWAERTGHLEAVTFLRLQEKLIDNTYSRQRKPQNLRRPRRGSRTNTNSSQVSLTSVSSTSTTPTGFGVHEETERFAQMALETDSD